MRIQLDLIDEFRIPAETQKQIRLLLNTSFPDCDFTRTRSYLKQLPPRRLLAWKESALVGQMGVEHRTIGLSGEPATVFGVIDLCIDPDIRGSGVASSMLHYLEKLGRKHHVDYIILFADDERIYRNNGYSQRGNRIRWTKIDEHETIGIGDEVCGELMVKELSSRRWTDGQVDLLGYLF